MLLQVGIVVHAISNISLDEEESTKCQQASLAAIEQLPYEAKCVLRVVINLVRNLVSNSSTNRARFCIRKFIQLTR